MRGEKLRVTLPVLSAAWKLEYDDFITRYVFHRISFRITDSPEA